jgi:hypothetical protein
MLGLFLSLLLDGFGRTIRVFRIELFRFWSWVLIRSHEGVFKVYTLAATGKRVFDYLVNLI